MQKYLPSSSLGSSWVTLTCRRSTRSPRVFTRMANAPAWANSSPNTSSAYLPARDTRYKSRHCHRSLDQNLSTESYVQMYIMLFEFQGALQLCLLYYHCMWSTDYMQTYSLFLCFKQKKAHGLRLVNYSKCKLTGGVVTSNHTHWGFRAGGWCWPGWCWWRIPARCGCWWGWSGDISAAALCFS